MDDRLQFSQRPSSIKRTLTKCSDKRLNIDLAALRQVVWLTPDGELRDNRIRSARHGEMDRQVAWWQTVLPNVCEVID